MPAENNISSDEEFELRAVDGVTPEVHSPRHQGALNAACNNTAAHVPTSCSTDQSTVSCESGQIRNKTGQTSENVKNGTNKVPLPQWRPFSVFLKEKCSLIQNIFSERWV